MAAALCPRLLRGRGAKEASAQTQFEEDRRQSNLPHLRALGALVQALDERAAVPLKHHAARYDSTGVAGSGRSSTSRLRDCAVSMSANFEPDGTQCSGGERPLDLPRHLLYRILAYRLQADRLGDLDAETLRLLDRSGSAADVGKLAIEFNQRRTDLSSVPCWSANGTARLHRVMVLADGFAWNDKIYPSLSKVAFAMTGTRWNGPRFFGLRDNPSTEG